MGSDEVTGVVLAGGRSHRMGRNKAFLELGGRPLIAHVVERLARVCAEVLVVASDVRPYADLGVPVVPDRFQGVGVLGGLQAGLAAAAHDLTLAVGCDMPFLNPHLLRAMAGWARGFDVVVLRHGPADESEYVLFVEPLHAAYRRTCMSSLEEAIRAGERRIVSFFSRVQVRYVTPDEVAPFDPDMRSFRNVNTPEEWEAVQAEWAADEDLSRSR